MAEEFDEEEVWASARDNRDARPRIRKPKGASSSSHTCSTSTTLAEGSTPPAPINIPNWCKTYKRSSSCDDEEEDEEGEWLPPHEWLAKRLARSQISSSSVCEGAGRTLKGRDQRRVRNAVLTKTGFLE
ncbi:hypothetical protein HPP92_013683 [Vanilla planifolia]|uniref:Senescence regulator n=1 Tax=Vanilla planifolia TaxID=51239 RepID=A0A835QZ06_VANPL|nr:hypothetical protein HPP92_013683 [Vanilla planifolia]